MAGMAFLKSARRLGVRIHAVELPERKHAYVADVGGFTDCRGLVDELWAEGAHFAAAECTPDGVLAFNEPHVIAAALVQDELGLPGPSLRAAVVSRNKALQRARFAAAGIGQPEYIVVDDLRSARDWAMERLPVVVKPLSSSGSAGVEQVADEEMLDAVIERRSGTGRLLVEKEVTGPEFSWEAMVVDGKVWCSNVTAKETTGPPQYVEVVQRSAALVEPELRRRIEDLGEQVLSVLSMRTGMVHLEFRVAPEGISVMEVAVRLPGDGVMELLELSYGENWYDLLVRAALGWELPKVPSEPRLFAASYLPPMTAGTVTRIDGLEEIRNHPLVVSADIFVSVGQRVPATTHSLERAGQVVMAAPTRDELEGVLSMVREKLQVVIENDS